MFKNKLVLYTGCTAVYLTSCNMPANSCIDPAKIKKDAICTMQYEPVCGCDKQTYSNACLAENAGVTSYTNGTCN